MPVRNRFMSSFPNDFGYPEIKTHYTDFRILRCYIAWPAIGGYNCVYYVTLNS